LPVAVLTDRSRQFPPGTVLIRWGFFVLHYYQFNIGDYHSHTSRLSLLEDLAYRRLIDLYYLNERPLNGCLSDVAREIGMLDNQAEVEYVLGKFFVESDGEWSNKRADQEIAAYRKKRKQASDAGKASAKARQVKGSEQAPNDRSTDVQPTINQEPLTNNQEKDKTLLSGSPDTPPRNDKNHQRKQEALEVIQFLNEKTGRNYRPVDSNLRMIIARLKEYTLTELLQVVAKKTREWGPDEKMEQFLRPATLFNATNCAQYVGELGQRAAGVGQPKWWEARRSLESMAHTKLNVSQGDMTIDQWHAEIKRVSKERGFMPKDAD
jgi:uncharacterized phage protein (TIGR02220 family)